MDAKDQPPEPRRAKGELEQKITAVSYEVDPVKEDEKQPLLADREEQVKGKATRKLSKLKWRKWLLVCELWVAQVFMVSAYSLIAPFFPSEADEKGSNVLITGVIISASPFCLVVCSPLFGYFLPKLGMKFTLVSGMFLVGGGFLLMGFLVDMPSGLVFIIFAILLRMTEGVGWSMCTTTTFSLLAQLFPTRVGTVTGLMEVATGLGFTAGPPIGALLYDAGGFRLPFNTVGGAILLLIPVTMILMKPTSCSSRSLSLGTLFRLLTHLSIFMLMFGNVVSFCAITFFNPTFEPFLSKEFGLNKIHIGLVFLTMPAVYVPLAFVVGRLSDKFGTRKFIVSGFLISGIALFLLGPADFISTPRLWITITALVIAGIGLPATFVPVYSDLLKQAHNFYPNEEEPVLTSVVSGVSIFSISLGEFIGPLIGGVLVQISDFPTCSLVIGEAVISLGFLILGVTLIDRVYQR